MRFPVAPPLVGTAHQMEENIFSSAIQSKENDFLTYGNKTNKKVEIPKMKKEKEKP